MTLLSVEIPFALYSRVWTDCERAACLTNSPAFRPLTLKLSSFGLAVPANMEVIQSLIDSRNYNELVNVCEQMELDVGPLLSLVLNTFADISVY